MDCILLSLGKLRMKTQLEVFTGRQVWNVSTCDSESARWEISLFFFNWDKGEQWIFLRGGENLGSWLLTIVSSPFICLYSNRRIICLKWHHIVDGREAYCLPFMSRMKGTESQCSSRWDRRASTITLPHLHKASIHPLASQDWGFSPLRPRRRKRQRAEDFPGPPGLGNAAAAGLMCRAATVRRIALSVGPARDPFC